MNTVAFDLERLYIEVNHSNQWSQTLLVSGEYYAALGVNTLLGRTITERDDKARSLVAVLDYSPPWVKELNAWQCAKLLVLPLGHPSRTDAPMRANA